MSKQSQHENLPNMYFAHYHEITILTYYQKYEKKANSEEFVSRTNQNNLPLKKRFGKTSKETCGDFTKEPETYSKTLALKKQNIKRSEKEHNVQKPKERKARILPGVIRHTSCPDSYLAYYYKYDK
jgi:hypothetical protein